MARQLKYIRSGFLWCNNGHHLKLADVQGRRRALILRQMSGASYRGADIC